VGVVVLGVSASRSATRAVLRVDVAAKEGEYSAWLHPPMLTTGAIQWCALYLAEMEVAWAAFRKAVGLPWKAQSEGSELFSVTEMQEILARGTEADKAAAAIEGVVAWVASNRARMQWHANAPDNSLPIIGRMKDERGTKVVYLLPDALHDYLKGRGLNVKAVVSTFLDRGHLVRGDGRSTPKISLGGGTPWVYRLSPELSALCGEEHDRGDDAIP